MGVPLVGKVIKSGETKRHSDKVRLPHQDPQTTERRGRAATCGLVSAAALCATSAGDSFSCSAIAGLDAPLWRPAVAALNTSSCAAERFLPIAGRTARACERGAQIGPNNRWRRGRSRDCSEDFARKRCSHARQQLGRGRGSDPRKSLTFWTTPLWTYSRPTLSLPPYIQ